MRLLLAVGMVAAMDASAWGTCDDECCDTKVELVGWSEDGTTWATIETPGEPVLQINTAKKAVARFGRVYDDAAHCGAPPTPIKLKPKGKYAAVERINIEKFKPLRKYKLKRLDKAWRKAFDKRFTIAKGKRRDFKGLPGTWDEGSSCTSWELRDGDKVLKSYPSECDLDDSDLISANFRGGYLHPNGKVALVKIRWGFMGLSSTEEYVLVKL